MQGESHSAAAARADSERRVREAARVFSLRTREYIAAVSHVTQLHDADVHAVGVLHAAEHRGEVTTAGGLARELALSAAAVTALVHRMERAGHIVRERSSSDGRSVTLHTTDSARSMSHDMFDPMVEVYGEVSADYDDAELALIAEVLERLADATRDQTTSVPARARPAAE